MENYEKEFEERKKELKDDFANIYKMKSSDLVKHNKLEEIDKFKPLKNKSFYDISILKDVNEDIIKNFEVELEFVESEEQRDIFEYYRIFTSCITGSKPKGRHISILVKEKHSQKYIGILSLSSDIFALNARDTYIGWSNDSRKRKLNHIMNITCCVGLRPNSYNLNIGKLLALIPFSKEVQEYHKKKYGHYLAGIITTSIYGKSIQYSQLDKYMKYIGLTAGFGVQHIPNNVYEKGIQLLKDIGYDIKKLSNTSSPKMRKIQAICRLVGISDSILQHNLQRGIYFGFTSQDSQRFLKEEINDFKVESKTLDEIVNFWKSKFAMKRYLHLQKTNRLKTKTELNYFIQKYKAQEATKKYRENMKERLGVEKYKELINKKENERYHQKKIIKYAPIELSKKLVNKLSKEYDIHTDKLTNSYIGGCFDACGVYYSSDNSFELLSSYLPIIYLIKKKFGGQLMSGIDIKKIFHYKLIITGEEGIKFKEYIVDNLVKEQFDKQAIPKNQLDKRLDEKYLAGYFDQLSEIKIQEISQKIKVSDEPLTEEKKIMKYSIHLEANSKMVMNMINDKFDNIGKIDNNKNYWKVESLKIKSVLNSLRNNSIKLSNQIVILDIFLGTVSGKPRQINYDLNIHKLRRKCKMNLENIKDYNWKTDLNQLPILDIKPEKEQTKIITALEGAKINELTEEEKKKVQKKKAQEKIKCPLCSKEMTKNALYLHQKKTCPKIGLSEEDKKEKLKVKGKEKINCKYCGNLLSRNALYRHYKESCKNYPSS